MCPTLVALCAGLVMLSLPAVALAQPDLKIERLSVYSTTKQSDGRRLISVSFRVVNVGTQAASRSVTHITINQSAVSLQTPGLQPQEVAYLSHFLRTTAGPASIVIDADALHQVPESEETNNGVRYTADMVDTEDGRWQFIGPTIVRKSDGSIVGVGRVTTLAIDPRTPDTVYVGARGTGVWKTMDSGGT